MDEFELLQLGSPTGSGQTNDPDDVAALDRSLRRVEAYAPPHEYAHESQRYATEPMIRALKALQEQNGLRIDGYANPAGPTERAINNRLLEKPKGVGMLFDPPMTLTSTVGNGFNNRRGEVATVQRMLGALGDLPEDPFDRPHGFIDENTTDAIKAFQRRKGLHEDGWLGPGGETERALQDAVAALGRAKSRDWLRYAERAGRAQARLEWPLANRSDVGPRDEIESVEAAPVAWAGMDRDQSGGAPKETPSASEDEGRIEPAQAGDIIVPPFLWLLGALGLGAATKKHLEGQARRNAEAGPPPVGKTEHVPPRVPDQPFRGPDPAKPSLDSKQARPSPSPAQSPHNPEQERMSPPRIDPRDFILITPDQSEEWADQIFIERRGNEKTRAGLEVIAQAARNVAGNRSDVKIKHVGGSRDKDKQEIAEYYAPNRDGKARGEDGRKGGSYADLTIEVEGKLVHISFYRAKADGSPKPIEIEQAIRLAYNSPTANLLIMIENKYGKEAIDQKALERFLEGVVDAVRGGAGSDYLSVRDPRVRDRIVRYFDAYKRR